MLRIHHTYDIVIFKIIQCGYFSTYIDDQYEGVNKLDNGLYHELSVCNWG